MAKKKLADIQKNSVEFEKIDHDVIIPNPVQYAIPEDETDAYDDDEESYEEEQERIEKEVIEVNQMAEQGLQELNQQQLAQFERMGLGSNMIEGFDMTEMLERNSQTLIETQNRMLDAKKEAEENAAIEKQIGSLDMNEEIEDEDTDDDMMDEDAYSDDDEYEDDYMEEDEDFEDEYEEDENVDDAESEYQAADDDIDMDEESDDEMEEDIVDESNDFDEDDEASFIEQVVDTTISEEDEEGLSEEDKEMYTKRLKDSTKIIRDRVNELFQGDKVTDVEISQKAISFEQFKKRASLKKNHSTHEAEWVLPHKGVKVRVSALTANEILKLDPNQNQGSKIQNLRDSYRIVYDHIVSEKPKSFEVWLKDVYAEDLDSLYFALYKACFENANHAPVICDSCLHAHLTEDIKIKDMVHFNSKKDSKKFYKILEHGSFTPDTSAQPTIGLISPYLAVRLKRPTLHNLLYENQSLSESFIEKNQEVLNIISYIDEFYMVDSKGKYVPIQLKTFPDSISKTIKYKITSYMELLNGLTSDEYGKLINLISGFNREESFAPYYQMKTVKCPKCNTEIKAEHQGAINLLFNRHRLVTMVNLWES